MTKHKIFISSVQKEFRAERRALTKYIEKAGTGTIDMYDQCRKAGLKPPEFHVENGFFILTVWRKKPLVKTESATQSADPVIRLLLVLQKEELSAGESRLAIKIKHRPTFRANYLHPALKAGLIEYTIPDKPNSRLQKYRITLKGRQILQGRLSKTNWFSQTGETKCKRK